MRYNDRDPDVQHMVRVADNFWEGTTGECTFDEVRAQDRPMTLVDERQRVLMGQFFEHTPFQYIERMKVAPHLRTLITNLIPRTLGTSGSHMGMEVSRHAQTFPVLLSAHKNEGVRCEEMKFMCVWLCGCGSSLCCTFP